MLKKIFILLFVPASLLAAEPMTVDQAVATALRNNANVQNAQLEVEKGQTRLEAAKTKRLPQVKFEALGSEALTPLSLTIEKGAFGDFEGTGPIPNNDTKIELARTFNTFALTTVSQPITQLYRINLGVQLRESSLASDQEQAREARQAIAREVKSAYYNVLAAESYASAAREAVTTYEEVTRQMTVRVSQKSALEADRLDATARLAATKATLLSAENTLATAKDQLNYLVGAEIDVMPVVVQSEVAQAGDVSKRPDVRTAQLQLEQARLDAKMKRAERIPDVSLTVSHATPINFDVLPSHMNTAGITISYEPITWGRRSAEFAEKRHAVEQAENSLRDRRAYATLEINAKRRKLEEASLDITVKQLELETARERMRVTHARFQERAARQDEMYAASANVTQAVALKQQAISAYWTARADYEKAIGED